jgi:hypothetical protein
MDSSAAETNNQFFIIKISSRHGSYLTAPAYGAAGSQDQLVVAVAGLDLGQGAITRTMALANIAVAECPSLQRWLRVGFEHNVRIVLADNAVDWWIRRFY